MTARAFLRSIFNRAISVFRAATMVATLGLWACINPTIDDLPPMDVTELVALPGNAEVRLSWRLPTDDRAEGLVILKKTQAKVYNVNDPNAERIYDGDVVSDFVDQAVENGTLYYYRVFTWLVDTELAAGKRYSPVGIDGQAFPFDPNEHPLGPLSPVFNVSIEIGDGRLLLNWVIPPDSRIDSVRVIRKLTPGFSGPEDSQAELLFSGLSEQWVDENLLNGTTYYYGIFAYDGDTLVYSQGRFAQGIPDETQNVLSPVSSVSVQPGNTINTISWVLPNDPAIDGVRIVRNLTGVFSSVNDGETIFEQAGGTSFVDAGLTNGTLYYYAVYTYDSDGNLAGPIIGSATPSDTVFGSMFSSGINGVVLRQAVQPDGKVILLGKFSTILERFNVDGTRDPSFTPANLSAELNKIYAIEIAHDGKIIIAGGNHPLRSLIRLNVDGTRDMSFQPPVIDNGQIYALKALSNGKLAVGGSFTLEPDHKRLILLNENGSLDTSFRCRFLDSSSYEIGNPSSVNVEVRAIEAVSSDQTFLVVGGRISRPSQGWGDNVWAQLGRISINNTDRTLRRVDTITPSGTYRPTVNQLTYRSGSLHVGGIFVNTSGNVVSGYGRYFVSSSSGNISISSSASIPNLSERPVFEVQQFLEQPSSTIRRVYIGGQNIQGGTFNQGGHSIQFVFSNSSSAFDLPDYFSQTTFTSISRFGDSLLIGHGGNLVAHGPEHAGRYLSRLNIDGSLNNNFPAEIDAVGQPVELMVKQNDKIWLGGNWADENGPIHLKRFFSSGVEDTSFNTQAALADYESITKMGVFSDGSSLVIGRNIDFPHPDFGLGRFMILKLNTDGTIDSSFPELMFRRIFSADFPREDPRKISIDGYRFYVGGGFREKIRRYHSNGQLDSSFMPFNFEADPANLNRVVYEITLLDSGKIMVGGDFTDRILRLNSHGSRDYTFNPPQLEGTVRVIKQVSDGKVLVGGDFTGLKRLNADGSIDNSFNPPSELGRVHVIFVQNNGKILTGGYENDKTNQVRRLLPNGAVDLSWNPNGEGFRGRSQIYQIIPHVDGFLVGGAFMSYNQNYATNMVYLDGNGNY